MRRDPSEPPGRKSSPTSTRTSTCPPPEARTAPPSTWQAQAETIVRGAARTAFTHHNANNANNANTDLTRPSAPALRLVMSRGRLTAQHRPVSAGLHQRPPHGGKPASATIPGQGKGKGKDKDKGGQKKTDCNGTNNTSSSKEKGKGKVNGGGKQPDLALWAGSVAGMVTRVVGGYWQVVSPVFDGESGLRRRLDNRRATGGDGVVCVLAVVFLFLAVSGGVWAVRGGLAVVRVLGEVGGGLRVVAGLG